MDVGSDSAASPPVPPPLIEPLPVESVSPLPSDPCNSESMLPQGSSPSDAPAIAANDLIEGTDTEEQAETLVAPAEDRSLDEPALQESPDAEIDDPGTPQTMDAQLADNALAAEAVSPEALALGDYGSAGPDELKKNVDGHGFESARDPESSASETLSITEPLVAEPHADEASRSIPPCSLTAERVTPVSRRRTFFLVRMPRTADSSLRSQIKMAEFQLEEASKNRDFIRAAYQMKRASKTELVDKLKTVREKERVCKDATQQQRMQIEPLQSVLNRLRAAQNTSEEELNDKIANLTYKLEHESNPLNEEKQLLRQLKLLESTRSQVCANAAAEAELIESFGSREEIQDQCSVLYHELDLLRDAQLHARRACEPVEKQLHDVNLMIDDLMKQLENAQKAQQEAFRACKQLKRLQGEQNFEFYKNKDDVMKARELAAVKKIDELEAFCNQQVERILTRWITDTDFREKYIKSNEQSTLRRLQTLDGRSLGPDEDPIFLMNDLDTFVNPPVMKSKETAMEETSSQAKPLSELRAEKLPTREAPVKLVKGTSTKVVQEKTVDSRAALDQEDLRTVAKPSPLVELVTAGLEQPENPAMKSMQTAELKERRRQEEVAKAKEAAERKKRQAERAQAKALLRAQKEAERREKEKEKKARKKANAIAPEPVDVSSDTTREVEPVLEETSKDISGAVQGPSPRRKKPSVVGKKVKVSRPPVLSPLPKKGFWSVPVWAWTFLVLSVLLGLLMFSKKPLSFSSFEL